MKSKIAILTGAGISAASGLKTFRGEGGLWEGYDIMQVASIEGWRKNKELVLDFYNMRRAQLRTVKPNQAHLYCSLFEQDYDVHIITQNVDDLHERAGSSKIIHLHGSLNSVRSTGDHRYKKHWTNDLLMGDLCPSGYQLRPDIVWFGEQVPKLAKAAEIVSEAKYIFIVGTSMQVYPAAGLIAYAPMDSTIYYIDPQPQLNYELYRIPNLNVIEKNAIEGLKDVYEIMTNKKGDQ